MSSTFFQRLRSLRAELAAVALLLPLAVVLGFVLSRYPAGEIPPTATASVPGSATADTALPVFSSPVSTTGAITAATQTITLEIKSPSGMATYGLPVMGETTVAELLALASREHRLRLETKDYGGTLGIFVEGINGTRNDAAREWYWTLYVNGTKSPLGASSARVRAGDRVTWSLEPMTSE